MLGGLSELGMHVLAFMRVYPQEGQIYYENLRVLRTTGYAFPPFAQI